MGEKQGSRSQQNITILSKAVSMLQQSTDKATMSYMAFGDRMTSLFSKMKNFIPMLKSFAQGFVNLGKRIAAAFSSSGINAGIGKLSSFMSKMRSSKVRGGADSMVNNMIKNPVITDMKMLDMIEKKAPKLTRPSRAASSAVTSAVSKSAAGSSLGSVAGSSVGAAKGLGMLGKLAGPVGGILMGIATAAGILVGALAPLAMLGYAVGNSMRVIEGQVIRLKSAMQNAVGGTLEFQKALLFAGQTPFAVTDVTEAVAGLRTFQFEPFKAVDLETGRRLVDVLGDMAGAMGTDMATASWALQRAMVGEWEIMQNNFQISARMIPQLKGLTSGTKAYGDAIVDFLSKQQRFVGGLEETANSIKGLISNISDAPSNFLIGVGSVDMNRTLLHQVTLYQSVKNSLREVYDAVSQSDAMTRYGRSLLMIGVSGKNAKEGLEMFKKGASLSEIKQFAVEMGGFTDQALESFKQLDSMRSSGVPIEELAKITSSKDSRGTKQSKMMQLMASSKTAQGASRPEAMTAGLDAAYTRIEQILFLGQALGQVFRVIWEVFAQPIFEGIGNLIDGLLQKSFSFIEGFIGPLESLSTNSEKNMSETIETIATKMGVSAETFSAGLETLSAETNRKIREASINSVAPLEKAILIISILLEFLKLEWIDKFGWMFDITGEIGSSLTKGFMDFFAWFPEGWSVMDEAMAFTLKDLFGVEDYSTFDFLMSSLKDLGEAILGIVNIFTTDLGEGMPSVMGIIGAAIGGVLNFIVALIAVVIKIIAFLIDPQTWIKFASMVETAVKAVMSFISEFFNSIINAVVDVGKGIANIVSSIWNSITSTFTSIATAIGSGISSGFDTIKTKWTEVKNWIWNNTPDFIKRAINSFSDETPTGAFYGAARTKEGLYKLHNDEMVLPAKIAEPVRDMLGLTSSLSSSAGFEQKISRATSRAKPNYNESAFQRQGQQASVSQAPANINFNPTYQIGAVKDKTMADYLVNRTMSEFKQTVAGIA